MSDLEATLRRKGLAAPPPGPPWDQPFAEAPFAFVDLEMDGLDVRRHRVLEVCIERVTGGVVVDRLETVVSPFTAAELASLTKVGNEHVHGIGKTELERAPSFADVAEPIDDLLDGAVFVAHAATYDARFLEMELARAGRPRALSHWLDTLTLARRALALPSHSMEALTAHFGVLRPRAHRAGDDVRALRHVWDELIRVLAPKSARDLWEVRIAERLARTAIVEACAAAIEKGLPVGLLYRPSRRKPEPMTMMLTELLGHLDPPRVIGYQLPGRARRELRADRILNVTPAEAGEPAPERP